MTYELQGCNKKLPADVAHMARMKLTNWEWAAVLAIWHDAGLKVPGELVFNNGYKFKPTDKHRSVITELHGDMFGQYLKKMNIDESKFDWNNLQESAGYKEYEQAFTAAMEDDSDDMYFFTEKVPGLFHLQLEHYKKTYGEKVVFDTKHQDRPFSIHWRRLCQFGAFQRVNMEKGYKIH